MKDETCRFSFRKIRLLLTQRITRFLQEQSKKDKAKYQEFYEDYKLFFKEGIIRTPDQGEKEDIAKLLRFESSREQQNQLISLEEYIERMVPEQKHIYFLAGPSRELCENSPYYEAIRQKGYEVLFVYESHDEVLLMQLAEFDKKKLKSVESEIETDTKKDDTIIEGGLNDQIVGVYSKKTYCLSFFFASRFSKFESRRSGRVEKMDLERIQRQSQKRQSLLKETELSR